jgi:DNA adenine methylase
MYKAVQREPEALNGLLQKWAFAHSLDPKTTFEEVKLQYNAELLDDANAWHHRFDAVGAMFMYLQATSFNGLYRTNKKGAYNVPIGDVANPRVSDPDRVRAASEKLYGVDLLCSDYSHVVDGATSGSFLYVDPPYDTPESCKSFTAYSKSGFNQDAQRALAKSLAEASVRGALFMLSNADTPLINEIYAGFDIQRVSARRSVSANGAQRGRVQELVIRNYR